jgi:hypothetical protein
MMARVVEERRRETGMTTTLVSVGSRGRVSY